MFQQAGIRPHRKTICFALIGRVGRRWIRPARLVRFYGTWEYAWEGWRGLSWPEQIMILTLRDALPADLQESRLQLEASPLP